MMQKGMTCTMCSHEHKLNDGSCDCGCGKKEAGAGAKVCTMCGHEHKKEGGMCDCGCGKM